MPKKLLITGSCGLVGSEVARYFSDRDWEIHGVDNNQRAVFFGPGGDTNWVKSQLESELAGYHHYDLDVRHRSGILELFQRVRPDAVVHAAAQPSHDRAAEIPFDDFDTNAVGTLNLLESTRQYSPDSPFVFMSTNKVYGDGPNHIRMSELDTRWEFADPNYQNGIAETFRIDQSKHSLFGASKVAADILVQEYGRYYGLPTCCLRAGCVAGPDQAGVQLHGFLSYLIKCNIEQIEYTIFGYKGKQLRDNIHTHDIASFAAFFVDTPRVGEVYNIGGGKENTCSLLEAFVIVESITGESQRQTYVDKNRIGDHICYFSDLRKIKNHYPDWSITKPLDVTIQEIVTARQRRAGKN